MERIAFLLAAIGAVFAIAAIANVSPEASWQRTVAKGVFADRESFTDRGWIYRNLALLAGGAAILIFLAALVIGG